MVTDHLFLIQRLPCSQLVLSAGVLAAVMNKLLDYQHTAWRSSTAKGSCPLPARHDLP